MEALRSATARRALQWHSTIARPRNWVCQSCLSRSTTRSRRSFATEPPSKPYYVTTPIFYVNASPHVGHMYSMVLADVLKRWQTLGGHRALLCTGTDEHGMKVQQAAASQDVEPKQWCDENAAKFESLARATNVDYDRFIRTTDADHVDAVRHFWFLLEQKGLIYESKHEGWYCVSDECFYPESMIERRQDVFTGEVYEASKESGNRVEWTEEKNYHFRMTALRDRLLQFYEENPEWVVPAERMDQVVDWVKNNLEDLSISRPARRLSWGISVPNDESQTIYVWVDALVNYMTFGGFPNWAPGQSTSTEGGWPADVHVIGKDILRFHCVYWPALLLALDLPLPKKVLSHAHWTMDHRKMSKSLGNVVNPFSAIERFGLDTMRFYMIHDGGISNDADYHNQHIVTRYKKLLQGGVGNLAARITRAKAWSLAGAVKAAHPRDDKQRATFEDKMKSKEHFAQHLAVLQSLAPAVAEDMRILNPSAALKQLMGAISEGNKFITNVAPWDIFKLEGASDKQRGHEAIYLLGETLRIVGILLQPFIPDKSAMLLDVLGVSPKKRTLADAQLFSDPHYGKPLVTPDKGKLGKSDYSNMTVFPPLPVED